MVVYELQEYNHIAYCDDILSSVLLNAVLLKSDEAQYHLWLY